MFRQQIQSAIEQGRLKFEAPKKPMKIDRHPFPTNMVDVGGKKNVLKTNVLTSQSDKKYGFDITKADKIFNLLLLEGQIKLKTYDKIPTDQELKNIKYCKWHNTTSHDTNECKVFRQ